jgi:hypothetical protein
LDERKLLVCPQFSVGKYRLGSIKNAEGWKFDGMTVKEALDAGARKLLTDGRFDK